MNVEEKADYVDLQTIVMSESQTHHTSTDAKTVVEHNQRKSKKRKSGTDLQDQHPIKRLRKSRRLEEKRLAKQLKPKVD